MNMISQRIRPVFGGKDNGVCGICRRGFLSALLCLAACLPMACDSVIYDDLQQCGVRMRFVYDYNMEKANALPAQVDCLTVLVYDAEGRYVDRYTATRAELSDENYRMRLPLAPGQYQLVAYGGMECSDATFAFTTDPAATPMTDRKVRITTEENGISSGQLHNLFYGALSFEVPLQDTETAMREYKVEMLKNTNNIRVMLQHLNGAPAVASDFNFEIVDDNVLFDYANRLIPTSPMAYQPWISGEADVGLNPSGTTTQVAYAELSTSRLVWRGNAPSGTSMRVPQGTPGGQSSVETPLLRITNAASGTVVVEIPLINYLVLAKSEAHADMSPQEFLDRISEWNLTFFLDEKGVWLDAYIKVNDWVVRKNDIDTAPATREK